MKQKHCTTNKSSIINIKFHFTHCHFMGYTTRIRNCINEKNLHKIVNYVFEIYFCTLCHACMNWIHTRTHIYNTRFLALNQLRLKSCYTLYSRGYLAWSESFLVKQKISELNQFRND